jgi:hypothetical protein
LPHQVDRVVAAPVGETEGVWSHAALRIKHPEAVRTNGARAKCRVAAAAARPTHRQPLAVGRKGQRADGIRVLVQRKAFRSAETDRSHAFADFDAEDGEALLEDLAG